IDKCVIATPAIREHDALARRWPGGGEVALVDDDSEELSVLTHQGRRTKLAEGDGEIVQSAVGRRFRMSAEAFWQVHPRAADRFAATAVELSGVRPGDKVWDLYAGAGLFAAAFARE